MALSFRSLRVAGLACLAICCARGDVTLPYILCDHMVVQRDLPVHIWGKAAPGEGVSVAFRGASRSTTADGLGLWSIYLPPGEAGGPFEVSVKGRNAIVLKDVLVGDVWLASGQSNMEWPVAWAANAQAEIAAAKHPKIRLVRAMHRVSEYPLDNFVGQLWAECSPGTVANFSAAAYYFGRRLQEDLGVPIGLIQSAWGGTPLDAWTSLDAISADASLMPVIAEWARLMHGYGEDLLRYQKDLAAWKTGGRKHPEPELRTGPGGPFTPAGLYNAMIVPLTNYPIRGVIWYQGEENTAPERAPVYGRLFRTMIRDWRRAWKQGDFPFLFVQLAAYRAAPDSEWPELREAQRHALALANTAMAVTIDIGDPGSIHPKNKQEVGRRLARAARALSYGEKIEYAGPLYRQATGEKGALRLWFDHAGGGLKMKGDRLKGFEIAGGDHKFVPAEARIEGSTVVVGNKAVPSPIYVRYGWADYPDCNLFNVEGLPASPFRSE